MKKTFKSKWILLCSVVGALFALGGCSLGETLDEIRENRDLTAQVMYYANGGKFDGTPDVKQMEYKAGSPILNFGTKETNETGETVNPTSGTTTISREKYTFQGWYYGVDNDGNGLPDYADAEKKYYQLGDKVEFPRTVAEGEKLILVAKWQANVKVQVLLACDQDLVEATDDEDVAEEDLVVHKNGEHMRNLFYENDLVQMPSARFYTPFQVRNDEYVVMDYYMDAECTTPVEWSIRLQEGQESDLFIYVKYVKNENWTYVREAKDVVDMLENVEEGKRYWLTRDIQAQKQDVACIENFAAEIQGNGYTISGLTVEGSASNEEGESNTLSIFGNIAATAKISNLTLEDLTLEYEVSGQDIGVYFVFTSLAEGAVVSNVKLSGEMLVTKGNRDTIQNITGEDYSRCLYGGYENDAAYLTATEGNGFVVEGEAKDFVTIE